jgi:outer membrane lipopolysaccharide assembly protein LptE/RlpB
MYLPPPKIYILVFLALFLSVFISACGFHLKGLAQNEQIAYKTVKLVNIDLIGLGIKRALQRQFVGSGVIVVDDVSDAEIEIVFSQATNFNSFVTQRTGQGAASSELLKMSQDIVVNKPSTQQQVLRTTVVVFKNRTVDNLVLQSSSRELNRLKRQMSIEIALQIVTRINYSLNSLK